MKIMAIDYGDAHTGVAFSDPTGFLTGTTTTIHSRSADVVLSELARLAKEQGAEENSCPRMASRTAVQHSSRAAHRARARVRIMVRFITFSSLSSCERVEDTRVWSAAGIGS